MYRRLFGVPDEIGDMTRSPEMVERSRMIYRTMVFGHRKCFRVHRVVIGSPEGVSDTPSKCMGLMGQRGAGQISPWCAPSLDSRL